MISCVWSHQFYALRCQQMSEPVGAGLVIGLSSAAVTSRRAPSTEMEFAFTAYNINTNTIFCGRWEFQAHRDLLSEQ
ncbi:hypothetical protein Ddc_06292 [Ditylenchus destructor]|nr:hypothetical protein Ddc_06292 [Ditylenchus destructor]